MKARALRSLLNNTRYSISNHRKYIAVGSPMCHDLISVDKETLKVKYALDTFREGRKSLEGKSNSAGENELLFVWDKLHELIENGAINDIINGRDIIENPLPVFTVYDGELIESVTDSYGWPNTDDNGICMYENTHFPDKERALACGINEIELGIKWRKESIEEKKKELKEAISRLKQDEDTLTHLKSLLI